MPNTLEHDLQHSSDVSTQRIAKVYAEALLNAAEKHGHAPDVLEELQGLIGEVFKASPEIEIFLTSHAVGRDRKAGLLERSFSGRATETFRNFLEVLNNHERLDVVRPVAAAYQELYNQRANRIRVRVRTAAALPDDQRDRLLVQVRTAFGKEPMLDVQIDPELLGGLIVQVDDWLYDASVRSRLVDLRNQLIERSSHEIQSGRDRFSSANGN